jgi:hypothetical protein
LLVYGQPQDWPPCSSDPTPFDFFFQKFIEVLVYEQKLQRRDELLQQIMNVAACIQEVIPNVT